MASNAATFIAKRGLKSQAKKNSQQREQDDYYLKPVDKREHPIVKPKRTRKDVYYYHTMVGIPKDDAAILVQVKTRARHLDSGIPLGFTRIGASSIIGLLPGVGDFADSILTYTLIIRTASKISPGSDTPALKRTMYRNLVLGSVIGLTPVVGDIADTFFRCNTRNAHALEKVLLNRLETHDVREEKRGWRGAMGGGGRGQRVAALQDAQFHDFGGDAGPELPPRYEDCEPVRRGTAHKERARAVPVKEKSGGFLNRFADEVGRRRQGGGGRDGLPARPVRPDERRVRDGRF